MKYLFIVTESESANGICVKNVMKCLAKENQVYCVTNREWDMPEKFELNSIRYITVKPRLTYRINSMLVKSTAAKWKKKFLAKLVRILDRAKLVMTLPLWPWISPAYTRRIERTAEKLYTEEGVECIVPTYTQIDTLIAANRIKCRHNDVLYVPYFLDALSGGYGLRIHTPQQTIEKGLRWERKLLQNADWIIAMESSRAHHEHYSVQAPYYDRIRYFDLPLLCRQPVINEQALMPCEHCKLVYVGTLPERIRSPEYLLRVLQCLPSEQYQFWFVGTNASKVLNNAAEKDPRIRVVGRVEHELAMRYIAQADFLLNIGNSNPNMTPSKIFEYMSFGKPVISTIPVREEPSRRYLEKYPLALLLDEKKDDVRRAAMKVSAFIAEYSGISAEQNAVRNTFFKNTPEAFASFLETMDRR